MKIISWMRNGELRVSSNTKIYIYYGVPERVYEIVKGHIRYNRIGRAWLMLKNYKEETSND